MKAIWLVPLFLFACQTSPLGRKQLALVSDDQMKKMGEQAFAEMKSKQPVDGDAARNAYVRCVTERITSLLPGKQNWEVVVFQDDSANAFALPGGKIGVHSGLLKVAKNEHQLAAVLGHEVGHVLAAHSKERVSEQLATQGGLSVLDAILGNPADARHSLLMGALGLGAQFGVLLPHGRKQESEADVIGLELMAKAGFRPQESVVLWQNMEAHSGGQPPEFLSTHPSHGSRIQYLQENMARVQPLAAAAPRHPDCRAP